MPGFTSAQMRESWTYAVERDFIPPQADDGTTTLGIQPDPVDVTVHTFATGDQGEAEGYIPFDEAHAPDRTWFAASMNSDGTLLAVARKDEIHVYDLRQTSSSARFLRGHTADIDTVRFNPHASYSNVLISGAYGRMASARAAKRQEEQIILWDMDKLANDPVAESALDELAGETVSFLVDRMEERGLPSDIHEGNEEKIRTVLSGLLKTYSTMRLVPGESRVFGRLFGGFQNPYFDPSGTKLFYMPGARPGSNGDNQWDLCVLGIASRPYKTVLKLVGHRDAIMWAGYSPDGLTIATACWDGTFRLWDAGTGEGKHVFRTDKQNWTGAFSPDSKWFLGTDGQGIVRVWDVASGEELWRYEYGGWCRYVDWSADGRWIAVGGASGRIVLFDTEHLDKDEETGVVRPTYERILSFANSPEAVLPHLCRSVSSSSVRFLPLSGRTVLGCTTSLDHAVEVFDLDSRRKWRFSHPSQESKPVWDWSTTLDRLVMVSSDGIRLWKLD